MGCDSVVALPPATVRGETVFGKNSNRPVLECQRLVLIPRGSHCAGGRVRCQYIEIPQVQNTAQVLGSQPYWLWGLEHGVNEWGVAIGNHLVFAREPPSRVGLLGMDLVRLGLERGRSAAQAVEVITDLIESYGQGGAGYPDMDLPYNNSFLVADRAQAFLVEAAGRHWAARSVRDVGAASNQISIGGDWERLGRYTVWHARRCGWASGEKRGFDFAAAYRDREAEPEGFSEGRYARTTRLLAAERGRIDFGSVRRLLRDHDGRSTFSDGYPSTVCFHSEPFQNTVASAVATLGRKPGDLITFWACFGAPCVGVYLPYYLDAALPEAVRNGGGVPDGSSAWWGFRSLLEIVRRDPGRLLPRVRAVWDSFEDSVVARAEEIATAARCAGRSEAALRPFVSENVARMMNKLGELAEQLRGLGPDER